MIVGFYDEMADMARELLAPEEDGGLGQGTVQLKRVTMTPGPNEWTPGVETTTLYDLAATVRRVSQKYVDGTLIVATDNQITFAVPSTVPLITDMLVIDGDEHVMKDLRPIPAAGMAVAFIAFVSA